MTPHVDRYYNLHVYCTNVHTLLDKDTRDPYAAFSFCSYIAFSARSCTLFSYLYACYGTCDCVKFKTLRTVLHSGTMKRVLVFLEKHESDVLRNMHGDRVTAAFIPWIVRATGRQCCQSWECVVIRKKEGRMRKKENITEDYVAMSKEKTHTRTPETRWNTRIALWTKVE